MIMLAVFAYMLNARSHCLRLSQGALATLTLTSLFIPLTGCAQQETSTIQRRKFEDGVWSLSLSGGNQASVVNEKVRELRLTNDAGKNWRVIPGASVGDAFECAFMLNENLGWAVNHQGQVFNTKSAGESWIKISEIKDFTGAHQIEFLNERDGWLREFLSIWRTDDGGATWRKTLSTVTPGVGGPPSAMFVVDRNHVVASGGGGQVYITRDGGENWKIETPITGNVSHTDVWFVDQTHGWLTGYIVVVAGEKLRPLILETDDGGDNWREVSVEADLLSEANFLPSSICVVGEDWWLAGNLRIVNGRSINFAGVLLHSSNSGKSWSEIKFATDESIVNQVRFTDHEHGWLVAGDSLYRTEDAGKTWKRVLSLLPPA
ncbi:MAG TPA: YCF48-related protein [Pyrinomonadaceae bacterium]